LVLNHSTNQPINQSEVFVLPHFSSILFCKYSI
jgi:hypothetical protein